MLTHGFNEACKNIAASYMKVGYEYISVIRFWTTEEGDLPHLSYIFRNMEPLGIEFKEVYFYGKGAFIFI